MTTSSKNNFRIIAVRSLPYPEIKEELVSAAHVSFVVEKLKKHYETVFVHDERN